MLHGIKFESWYQCCFSLICCFYFKLCSTVLLSHRPLSQLLGVKGWLINGRGERALFVLSAVEQFLICPFALLCYLLNGTFIFSADLTIGGFFDKITPIYFRLQKFTVIWPGIITSWAIAPKLWIFLFIFSLSSPFFSNIQIFAVLSVFLHRIDGIILKFDMMIFFSWNTSGFRIFSGFFRIFTNSQIFNIF